MAESNKGKTFPPEILSPEEVQRLLRACSAKAPTGIRNRAIIALGYRSGLRLSEALNLHVKDIDLDQGFLNVLRGKGKKARIVGVDAGTVAMVEKWLEIRRILGVGRRNLAFCTLTGSGLKTAYFRALLPRLAKRAGIEKRVHFHGLRHSFSFELAREGVPVVAIQNALGHSNLGVTSRYLNHLAPMEQINLIRNRGWEGL